MIKRQIFRKENLDNGIYSEVERIGNELFEYLNNPQVQTALDVANKPKSSSSAVQNVFLGRAVELGFQSEKTGLFQSIPTSNLRPDYYRRVSTSGIIIEVERGKTIMNNMDMLDFWKCHLCESANHLFLFVPNELQHNNKSKPYDCFNIVMNRMKPFFEKSNYTNVDSLWIFGY